MLGKRECLFVFLCLYWFGANASRAEVFLTCNMPKSLSLQQAADPSADLLRFHDQALQKQPIQGKTLCFDIHSIVRLLERHLSALPNSSELASGPLPISVIYDDIPSAYTTRNQQILISTGLINLIHSPEELAYILAHEIGHYLLHSNRPPALLDIWTQTIDEITADSLALSLLEEAGFGWDGAICLLKKLSTQTFCGSNAITECNSSGQTGVQVAEMLAQLRSPGLLPDIIKDLSRPSDSSVEALLGADTTTKRGKT